eukprot:4850182-Pyramimonas_sp.AAC.2
MDRGEGYGHRGYTCGGARAAGRRAQTWDTAAQSQCQAPAASSRRTVIKRLPAVANSRGGTASSRCLHPGQTLRGREYRPG